MKTLVIILGIVAAIGTPAVAHFVDGYPVGHLAVPTVSGLALGLALFAFAHFELGKED